MPEPVFPMYVLPIDVVLALKRLPTHEEAFDQLVLWQPGMVTLFASHTWLTASHPDDQANSKLGLLLAFLRDAQRKRGVPVDWAMEITMGRKQCLVPAKRLAQTGYVWLDFWSIPQADRTNQGKAIQSIPVYVHNADFFLVVAGPWRDEAGKLRDLRA